MIVLFDGRRPHGDLDGCVRRLETLLDHLKRLGPGKLPDGDPSTRPTPCLTGLVVGQPRIGDPIVTGELWRCAPELGFAPTTGRLYRLGAPAGRARQ